MPTESQPVARTQGHRRAPSGAASASGVANGGAGPRLNVNEYPSSIMALRSLMTPLFTAAVFLSQLADRPAVNRSSGPPVHGRRRIESVASSASHSGDAAKATYASWHTSSPSSQYSATRWKQASTSPTRCSGDTSTPGVDGTPDST